DDGGVRARSIDPHQDTALALELADELLVAQVLHRDTSAGNLSTEASPRERARPTVGSTGLEDRGDQIPVCETEEDQRPVLTGDRLGVEADRIGAVERVLEQLLDATEEEPGDHLGVACPGPAETGRGLDVTGQEGDDMVVDAGWRVVDQPFVSAFQP